MPRLGRKASPEHCAAIAAAMRRLQAGVNRDGVNRAAAFVPIPGWIIKAGLQDQFREKFRELADEAQADAASHCRRLKNGSV